MQEIRAKKKFPRACLSGRIRAYSDAHTEYKKRLYLAGCYIPLLASEKSYFILFLKIWLPRTSTARLEKNKLPTVKIVFA